MHPVQASPPSILRKRGDLASSRARPTSPAGRKTIESPFPRFRGEYVHKSQGLPGPGTRRYSVQSEDRARSRRHPAIHHYRDRSIVLLLPRSDRRDGPRMSEVCAVGFHYEHDWLLQPPTSMYAMCPVYHLRTPVLPQYARHVKLVRSIDSYTIRQLRDDVCRAYQS